MESSLNQRSFAWRPLTPRGVAVFASASLGRLLLVQLMVAILVAGTVVWFMATDWFPTISAAIEHLPEQGAIQSGRLSWSGPSPQSLAESRFLGVAVDLDHTGQTRSPAHLHVELGQTDWRVYSLFGFLTAPYPKSHIIFFNSHESKPWWGAWAPMILAAAAAAGMLGLMTSWAVLATVYCLPVWLFGLYLNRELTICGSWRLAGAALMPGALLMTAAIVLYGLGDLDVIQLIVVSALHFLLGWVYLILSALAAPKLDSGPGPKVNPFATAQACSGNDAQKSSKTASANPFRPRGD
jgi:hypothetical protein